MTGHDLPEVSDPGTLLLLLDQRESLEESLDRLARTCRDAVAGCEDASVTLVGSKGVRHTAASTSERATRVDGWEYTSDRGPCISALKEGTEHYSPTIEDATETYGQFAEVLADAGYCCVLGVPLVVGDEIVGALNVYSAKPHAFDDPSAREIARGVAAQASTAVHNLRVFDASRQLAQQLEEAMASRAIIEQAKGVLMAQSGCTADEAFERLRSASQRENVKLRDVAARIVGSVGGTGA
jgi:GAF domain-containing protein